VREGLGTRLDWTMDWTMDWTVDWTGDYVMELPSGQNYEFKI